MKTGWLYNITRGRTCCAYKSQQCEGLFTTFSRDIILTRRKSKYDGKDEEVKRESLTGIIQVRITHWAKLTYL